MRKWTSPALHLDRSIPFLSDINHNISVCTFHVKRLWHVKLNTRTTYWFEFSSRRSAQAVKIVWSGWSVQINGSSIPISTYADAVFNWRGVPIGEPVYVKLLYREDKS